MRQLVAIGFADPDGYFIATFSDIPQCVAFVESLQGVCEPSPDKRDGDIFAWSSTTLARRRAKSEKRRSRRHHRRRRPRR
jgi:hypothetical protein